MRPYGGISRYLKHMQCAREGGTGTGSRKLEFPRDFVWKLDILAERPEHSLSRSLSDIVTLCAVMTSACISQARPCQSATSADNDFVMGYGGLSAYARPQNPLREIP